MTAADYDVRRFRPEDAAGVSACFQRVYGDTYVVHPDVYHPDAIAQENRTGRLISVVAIDPRGTLVGHYAVERPELGPIGETGEAVVLPEHRHHQLMERMRRLLVEEARRLRMIGLYGLPVTNHVFSQKMYEHTDGHPVGVCLGDTPKSFHNIAEPLTQRLSCLLYFEYLQKPPPAVCHAPPRHRDVLARIYRQFGIDVDFAPTAIRMTEVRTGAPPAGPGEIETSFSADLGQGVIRVVRCGTGSAGRIRELLREWRGAAQVISLDLPLAQAGVPDLCRSVEELGFFFSGLGPCFAGDGDALRLQLLDTKLDISQLQIADPFARELVDYVARERDRIGAGGIGSWGPGFTTTRSPVPPVQAAPKLEPSYEKVQAHYDLSDEFFALFLDPTMTYSCAFFERDGMTLEEAQLAKIDLALRKCELRPGMRLLDIGCGWGSTLRRAAERYGVCVTGLTLSRNQHQAASRSLRRLAAGAGRAEVRLQGWEEFTEPVDAIVSIGAFEHFRTERYAGFFARCREILPAGGRMLLQTILQVDRGTLQRLGIAVRHEDVQFGQFIRRQIFPGGQLCPAQTVVRHAEQAGFRVTQMQALQPHYGRTLEAWAANLRAAHDRAVALTSPEVYERYVRYLDGCARYFRSGHLDVAQFTLRAT